MKRTPIRRVSKKRAQENRIYAKRRLIFLAAHPYCQIWLLKMGKTESDVVDGMVEVEDGMRSRLITVPPATEVHHMNSRHGWRLLDETEWLAVCRGQHEWVKSNQSAARELGVLK